MSKKCATYGLVLALSITKRYQKVLAYFPPGHYYSGKGSQTVKREEIKQGYEGKTDTRYQW